MKILIIGANSYVGARIYFDLKNRYDLVGTYHQFKLSKDFLHLDITDQTELSTTIASVKPEIIIHVANFTSLNNIENDINKFRAVNLKATKWLVEAANKQDSKLIFISSRAANNPNSLYGELKYKSEIEVMKVKKGYAIIRPSIIIGVSPNISSPRFFNRILKSLDNNNVGQFDISWKLQPTYLGHISQTIEKIIKTNQWNKIIPIFIDEVTTQYNIAKDILSYFGIEIKPINKNLNIPLNKDYLLLFQSFKLSPKTYKTMIKKLITEIKNRDRFIIK